MSGVSYDSECPECGGRMDSYSDWKPYDVVDHQCLDCGFYAYVADGRMTLKEVNGIRADREMKLLKKLKKRIFD